MYSASVRSVRINLVEQESLTAFNYLTVDLEELKKKAKKGKGKTFSIAVSSLGKRSFHLISKSDTRRVLSQMFLEKYTKKMPVQYCVSV